jgi:hypothetical protein
MPLSILLSHWILLETTCIKQFGTELWEQGLISLLGMEMMLGPKVSSILTWQDHLGCFYLPPIVKKKDSNFPSAVRDHKRLWSPNGVVLWLSSAAWAGTGFKSGVQEQSVL